MGGGSPTSLPSPSKCMFCLSYSGLAASVWISALVWSHGRFTLTWKRSDIPVDQQDEWTCSIAALQWLLGEEGCGTMGCKTTSFSKILCLNHFVIPEVYPSCVCKYCSFSTEIFISAILLCCPFRSAELGWLIWASSMQIRWPFHCDYFFFF